MPAADQNPIGAAMDWVARIVAAAAMMVLPGLGGQWLDGKLDTSGFTLGGFVVGLVGGMWYLLTITKQRQRSSSNGLRGARSNSSRLADDAELPASKEPPSATSEASSKEQDP